MFLIAVPVLLMPHCLIYRDIAKFPCSMMSSYVGDPHMNLSSRDVFPIKKYNSSYLRAKQYSNRDLLLNQLVIERLKDLKLYKWFNPARGRKAKRDFVGNAVVSLNVSKPKTINVVVGRRDEYKRDYKHKRSVSQENVIRIKCDRQHFDLPVIMLTNLRSMANKFDSVEFEVLTNKPDLAVFSETWTTEASASNYIIDGYSSYVKNRARDDKHHGGGIMTFVKKGISVQSFEASRDKNLDVMTIITRPLLLPRTIAWIAYIVIYCPPCDIFANDLKSYLIEEIDRLFTINHKAAIFIIGDFNDFDCKFITNYKSFKQLVQAPSRGEAFLDKCYSNIQFLYSSSNEPPIESSDHQLILLKPLQVSEPANNYITVNFRPKKYSSIMAMGSALYNTDWSLLFESSDIEAAASFFHNVIYEIYVKCFPSQIKKINKNTPQWFSDELLEVFLQRKHVYIAKDWIAFNNINVKIKSLLKRDKEKWFTGVMVDCENGSSAFYDRIKKLLGFNSSLFSYKYPNKSVSDSFDETFDYFVKMANSHPPLDISVFQNLKNENMIPLLSQHEVFNSLKHVSSKGNLSPDKIPNFIWSQFAMELMEPVTSLVNLSLLSMSYPSIWKTSNIIFIPKIAIPLGPQDLRPISISSPVAKLCERHIFNVVMSSIQYKLDNYQFGGIPGKSTAQYLAIYIHNVLLELEAKSKVVFAIVTDFRKAFDNLDHNFFMSRFASMIEYSEPLLWMCSFLTHRKSIMINPYDNHTYAFNSSNGVPQGSVLGSLVFAVLVDDIARNYKCHLKYVDDLTILQVCESKDNLLPQIIANDIVSQIEAIGLQLNPQKCALIVHSFLKTKSSFEVNINGNQLNIVKFVKILGVIIQEDLRWNLQVEQIIKKANKLIFILYKLKRLGADILVLKLAYLTFIRPNLEYCAPVWCHALTKLQSDNIEAVQKRSVRIILGVMYHHYDEALVTLNLITLKQRRMDLALSFARSFFKSFPAFLSPTQSEVSGIVTRGAAKHVLPMVRTKRFEQSPIISAINLINSKM